MYGPWRDLQLSQGALKVADTKRFSPTSSKFFPREYRAVPHPLPMEPYTIRVHFLS